MLKKIVILGGGNAAAQFLSYLTIPIGIILYNPNEVGQYGVFFAIVGLLSSISSMRQDRIILSLRKRHVPDYLRFLLLFEIVVSILLMLILKYIIESEDAFLISLTVLLFCVSQFQQSGLVSIGELVKVNLAKASQSISLVISQLLLIFIINDKALALKLSITISYIVSLLYLFKCNGAWFNLGKKQRYINVKIFITNWRVLLFTWPSTMLNVLSSNIPILLIDYFLGNKFSGVYSLATRAVQVPAALFSQAAMQIFISDIKNNLNQMSLKFRSSMSILNVTSIVYCIMIFLLILIMDYLSVLPEEWSDSLAVGVALLPWVSQVIKYSASQSYLLMLKLNSLELKFNVVLLLFRLAVLYVLLYLDFSFLYVCFIFSITSGVIWMCYGEIIKGKVKNESASFMYSFLNFTLVCVLSYFYVNFNTLGML